MLTSHRSIASRFTFGFRSAIFVGFLMLLFALISQPITFAQTASATLSGTVMDSSGAVVPEVEITVSNADTNASVGTKTNSVGIYAVEGLKAGRYRIVVTKLGFKQITVTDVTLNVQDSVSRNFTLEVGATSETVTVSAEGELNINTIDASLSTVVDRQFVANMPLNGRSFQSLILLTPGIVNTSTQGYGVGAGLGLYGEFSVNGQRGNANYYMVDGVSANVGTARNAYGTAGLAGAIPASSALGTTHNLVSLDALEEFRIESSSYSAEYGRTPGGQFLFQTRSGTNQWHGTAFDYLRNTVFDANNWFNNYYGFPNPGERQNDFGGVFGGPVEIPHLYNGKDKTFFFFSYEGVRLGQPVSATVSYVPDLALRQAAPAALRSLLNAWPVPNGPELGTGLAEFIGSGTTPNSVNSTGIRLDHILSEKARVFFRFANTTSTADRFGESNDGFGFHTDVIMNTRSYTAGAASTLTNSLSNELRFNYTTNVGGSSFSPKSNSGGVAVDLATMNGVPLNSSNYILDTLMYFGSHYAEMAQGEIRSHQRQWNITDTFALIHGHHLLKFGIDYRRIEPDVIGQGNPSIFQYYFSAADALANANAFTELLVNKPVYPVFINTSLFAQDQWRVTPRLNLSLGLRWEYYPPPGNRNHTAPYVVQNADNMPQATVAPYGTPLWNTYWYNFAPRLGAAYMLRTAAGWETVVRVGGGLFYDSPQSVAGYLYGFGQPGYGHILFTSLPWPLTPTQYNLSVSNPPAPPYNSFYVYPKHLQSPYSLEWNASIQQSLGASQALTITYAGSHSGRLLGFWDSDVSGLNPNFSDINYIRSGFPADYDSLQVQFQRKLSHGVQALAGYTYAHCIDWSSNEYGDYTIPERGSCDYDIRHSVSIALSYDIPNAFQNGFAKAVLSDWGFDDRFTARSGYPLTLFGNYYVDPATGAGVYGGLNIVPGQPFYLYGSQYPGGREINPAAFVSPTSGSQVGDYPRNLLRAFGAWQMDMAIRREFPLHERLKLQFRAEAFNIFNHPNFGTINPFYCSPGPGCQFGRATKTLNVSLGTMSPLYQLGGPRSMQFALKLIF